MTKRLISLLVDGILSGIIVCVGCGAYMNSDNKVLGAVLFSFGLFVIVVFSLGLYTGKVGYIVLRNKAYVIEVLVTLVANFLGTVIGGTLLGITRMGEAYAFKALELLNVKFNDTVQSTFVLAFFCGMLMFIAVEGFERCTKSGNFVGTIWAVVLPVMIFIFCNFNHCIADLAFFSISRFENVQSAAFYFPVVIIGNACGGMFLPLCKKLSLNK
ncbi:MAG: formate/nitrite transporter family protein [Clostridia bacterium]